MAYADQRDPGAEPRNRYAAQRGGLARPRTAPAALSDVHRLAARLVTGAAVVLALAAGTMVLPDALGAVDGASALLAGLGPAK